MPYASRTGTRRNLAALRAAGWGLLLSATGVHRCEGFEHICLDNGAWTAHQGGAPWDEASFRKLVAKFGERADFVVVPDIVGGGIDSLSFSLRWLDWCRARCRRSLVAVQDGMTADDVSALLGPDVGIFLGGSTEFKLSTMQAWGELARVRGCWFHVGRVNSVKRISACRAAGADSFDGTSATRFAVTLPMLDRARKQPDLFAG